MSEEQRKRLIKLREAWTIAHAKTADAHYEYSRKKIALEACQGEELGALNRYMAQIDAVLSALAGSK